MDETTNAKPTNGGRITDEVRRDIDVCTQSGEKFDTVFIVKSALLCDLDRIDKAHEDALSRLYMDMSDSEWVRLPKDADGEVIHVGDELRDEWHEQNQGEVKWLMLDHHGWWLMLKNNCERFYVHEFHEWRHHHKQPTVEDVLTEFAAKLIERGELTNGAAQTIAEYAKRLTLRGDAE